MSRKYPQNSFFSRESEYLQCRCVLLVELRLSFLSASTQKNKTCVKETACTICRSNKSKYSTFLKNSGRAAQGEDCLNVFEPKRFSKSIQCLHHYRTLTSSLTLSLTSPLTFLRDHAELRFGLNPHFGSLQMPRIAYLRRSNYMHSHFRFL